MKNEIKELIESEQTDRYVGQCVHEFKLIITA